MEADDNEDADKEHDITVKVVENYDEDDEGDYVDIADADRAAAEGDGMEMTMVLLMPVRVILLVSMVTTMMP